MGKKSLLAPTSKEKTSNGENPEKEKQPLKVSGTAKTAAPKAPKKKASKVAASKKKAAPKTLKKKASKTAASKKTTANIKEVKKKAAPERSVRKKGAPDRLPVAAKSSYKTGDGATSSAEKTDGPAASQPSGDTFKTVTTDSPATGNGKGGMDPMWKMVVSGLAVLAVLLFMVLWTSASNVGKFYLKPVDDRLEIRIGRFSPKGTEKIYTLANTSFSVDPETVYSKEEVHALIFEDIIAGADTLLRTAEIPDFDDVRRTLVSAKPFAVSGEMTERLQKRLDKIDMMALAYKADILAGKGMVEDLMRALESLKKAMQLNLNEAEKGLIQQKINWIEQRLSEAEKG